jgi:hypothetical protein
MVQSSVPQTGSAHIEEERSVRKLALLRACFCASNSTFHTARLYAEICNAEYYGAHILADIRVDFPAVIQRMRRVRARISGADSIRRLSAAGVLKKPPLLSPNSPLKKAFRSPFDTLRVSVKPSVASTIPLVLSLSTHERALFQQAANPAVPWRVRRRCRR